MARGSNRGRRMYVQPNPDPTPDEISVACEMIRKGWDEKTRLSRECILAPKSNNVVRIKDIFSQRKGMASND